MNRRVILLNLMLLALLVWGGTELRRRWQEARRHEAEVLAKTPPPPTIAVPASPAPVAPAPAAEYLDVAQRTLFSADRNPNIEIQVEAPKPEPPVPPMPSYYGQMAIAEPVILLSNAGTPQKGYRVGDDIGEFKLIAFDREHVTLGWNGKELVRELRALAAKDEPPQARAPNVNSVASTKNGKTTPTTTARNPSAPKGANVVQIGGASNTGPATGKKDPIFGPPLGNNFACQPSDASPNGTVKDGFKKVIVQSLMGECYWEPTK